MKSHCAEATRRMSFARGSVLGAAVLVTVALISALVWGCGESASTPQGVSAATSESVATTYVESDTRTPAERSSSVHARVMAEHRLRMAAAAAEAPAASETPVLESPTADTTVGQSQATAASAAAAVVEPQGSTAVVLTGGQTPLRGVWSGSAERLASFLVGESPSPRFTVPVSVLAEYYVRYAAEAGLRADLLWAQMLHETGYGMYGGDVRPEQNNYAGVGATGGGATGVTFLTAEAGVMAHVAHMVSYVYTSSPVSWADANVDPRFDFVNPRGVASVLADLNGRWAVPGPTYGQSIEAIVRAINAG